MRHCRLLSCLLLHLNGRAHPLRLDSTWNFGRRARQVHTIESNKIIALGLYPNWHIVRPACPQHPLLVPSSSLAAAVSLLYHSGAFLHHIGLWSAPSVGRAICLLPRLFACYAVTCKSVACPHRLSSASPSASRLARSPPVPPAASVACPRRLSPVSLPYHAAATRHRIEPPFRFRIMPPQSRDAPPYQAAVPCRRNASPYRAAVSLPYHAAASRRRIEPQYRCCIIPLQRAAVSSLRIAPVSCRRNFVTRRRIKLPYHAAAARRRIEPPYRCRIMPTQRRDAPQYQAAVSCRRCCRSLL